MWNSLLIRKALPLTASYLLIVAGTLFFLFSFIYSVRKQKIIPSGPMKRFLQLHCHAGWIATLMIMVYSGIHFNALLPWAATALMLIVTASGHVGQHLVRKFRNEVKLKKQQLGIDTPPDDALDRQMFWDSVTVQELDR